MKCKRCGRPLKNKSSIKRGYGPLCFKKIKQKAIKKQFDDYL